MAERVCKWMGQFFKPKNCLSFYDQIQGRCEPFRQSQTENLSLLPHSVAHSHVTLCMSHYSLIKILTENFDIYVQLQLKIQSV